MAQELVDFFKWMYVEIGIKWIQFRWAVLGFYYTRVAVQAEYEYRQSYQFKERWKILGLDYAESKIPDEVHFYFQKVRRGSLILRYHLFLDAVLNRPITQYYFSHES